MPRYIDADELILCFKFDKNDSVVRASAEIAIDIIRRRPTADVARVVHGYWRKDRKGHFHCSECEGEALGKMEYENPRILLSVYCPHCGAKMNRSEEEK